MKRVLFLNITTFSIAGGIERFNKCMLLALRASDEVGLTDSYSISAYDTEMSAKYYDSSRYKCLAKNKFGFVLQSLIHARNSDVIILGHINLGMVGVLIKKLFPSKKVLLVTHGIDVWSALSRGKKMLLASVDHILSVSQFTADKMQEEHGVNPEKITVFPNTIDPFFPIPERLSIQQGVRQKYGIANTDFVLYTLTRLRNTELYKGYDKVIQAVSGLVNKYPELKYVLAGKYDLDERERIERLAQQWGVADHVVLTGFLEETELVAHYQLADTYIMPSKKEGFGIVFIEALVCGVPVIAGNADGSADALLHGELGTLVNPDSVEDIQAAIEQHLVSRPRDSEAERERVRKKTLDNFSFDRYKQRLQNVIAEC